MSSRIHAGGSASAAARRLILERFGGTPRCRRCGRIIDLSIPSNDPTGLGFTVGHVIPVRDGGSDAIDNLAPEHARCNKAAGARPVPPRATIARPVQRW